MDYLYKNGFDINELKSFLGRYYFVDDELKFYYIFLSLATWERFYSVDIKTQSSTLVGWSYKVMDSYSNKINPDKLTCCDHWTKILLHFLTIGYVREILEWWWQNSVLDIDRMTSESHGFLFW